MGGTPAALVWFPAERAWPSSPWPYDDARPASLESGNGPSRLFGILEGPFNNISLPLHGGEPLTHVITYRSGFKSVGAHQNLELHAA